MLLLRDQQEFCCKWLAVSSLTLHKYISFPFNWEKFVTGSSIGHRISSTCTYTTAPLLYTRCWGQQCCSHQQDHAPQAGPCPTAGHDPRPSPTPAPGMQKAREGVQLVSRGTE